MPDGRRKPPKSKYTSERNIPGAFAGETVTRRRFMTGSAHAAGAIATSAIALPALGFALGPLFQKKEVRWEAVGPESDFNATGYTPKVFTLNPGIGEAGKTTVYVRKHNPSIDGPMRDQYDGYVAIA